MENIFLNFTVTFTYVQSGVDNNTYTSDAYLNTKLDYFYFYTLAVIIWSGLVLNAMCILCFIRSKSLKRSTTGIYLIALASADFIYLSGEYFYVYVMNWGEVLKGKKGLNALWLMTTSRALIKTLITLYNRNQNL